MGFYAEAKVLVPDLKYESSIVIARRSRRSGSASHGRVETSVV